MALVKMSLSIPTSSMVSLEQHHRFRNLLKTQQCTPFPSTSYRDLILKKAVAKKKEKKNNCLGLYDHLSLGQD